MRLAGLWLAGFALASGAVPSEPAWAASEPSVLLGDLTWPEAERALKPETVVVIPLGAQAKEHGLHLQLDADFVMAEYFKTEVMARTNVVVAPTVSYGFYPAFVEYPGSTTLELDTARDVIVQICRTLSAFGPRRFYVVNIGVSTVRSLQAAEQVLAKEGLLLRYTDLLKLLAPVAKAVAKQEGGTHADEIETSMLLFIAPQDVEMELARKDFEPRQGSRLTRVKDSPNTYSPTGVWGDATLATSDKGKVLVRAVLDGMLADIQALRAEPLPGGRRE